MKAERDWKLLKDKNGKDKKGSKDNGDNDWLSVVDNNSNSEESNSSTTTTTTVVTEIIQIPDDEALKKDKGKRH